jgi:hypothetical protein
MQVQVTAHSLAVSIDLAAREATETGFTTVATRRWEQQIPRRA